MAYKQQKFISHSSGGWKSKIRVPAWSDEGPLLGGRFLVSFRGERSKGALRGLFYKGTHPIHEGFALMTLSPLKDPASFEEGH